MRTLLLTSSCKHNFTAGRRTESAKPLVITTVDKFIRLIVLLSNSTDECKLSAHKCLETGGITVKSRLFNEKVQVNVFRLSYMNI